jgi:hypothetical protein
MFELIFSSSPPTSSSGIIDGGCNLSLDLWPKSDDGDYLFHLVSFPANWVFNKESVIKKWISVFIPYDKNNYSHYSKMSSYESNHKDSFVILHDMVGSLISPNKYQSSESHLVEIKEYKGNDSENILSHIGGQPFWVQDQISVDEYHWVMSIYGPDIDISLPDNVGILSGGTLHIFILNNIDFEKKGVIGKTFFEL